MKLIAKAEKSKDVWFLLITSFIFFLLRLPSLFEPYWYGDEGIYQVVGAAIRSGRLLYRGIWDNKPPLLYMLYALFNSDQFTIRLVSIIFGILAVFVFFILCKKIFQNKQNVTLTVTSLFALLFGLPLLEGNIANAENFMLFPIILAGLLIVKLSDKKRTESTFHLSSFNFQLALAGLLLGVAFLFKVVAVFDFAAFFLFFLFLNLPIRFSPKLLLNRKNLNNLFQPLLVFAVGFLIPILTSVLFFLTHGAFKEFISATFVQNVSYVGYGNKFFIPQGFLILKLLLLILFILFLFIKRDKFSKTTLFVLIWFSFSLFNAFFSQRPYTHYLLVLLPSFLLLAGLIFSEKKYQLMYAVILIASLLFILKDFNFYGKTVFYYQNFISFLTGGKSVSSYQAFFDKETPIDYQIAEFINLKTTSKDSIFIWGNNAQLYSLTNKLPLGKYVVAYHITGYKDGIENTQIAIREKKPKFVIIMPNAGNIPFPIYGYGKEMEIDSTIIYERLL